MATPAPAPAHVTAVRLSLPLASPVTGSRGVSTFLMYSYAAKYAADPGPSRASVAADPPGSRYQFERTGYFVSDTADSRAGALVFNRTVALRDSWAKVKDK